MAEIAFEYFLAGLESAKGTKLDPPTHYLAMAGMVKPLQTRIRPDESRGTLAEFYRTKIVRQVSEWNAEGPADVYTLPLLAALAIKGGVTPTAPYSGVYLWTYAPTMNADDLKSATLYWGDPNIQALQAEYCMCDEITISADASGTDGVKMTAKGLGHFPAKDAPSSLPTMLNAPMLAPGDLELWIDATTIGTTPVTGRVISAEITIPSGVVYKYWAGGTTSNQQYQGTGRKKRHAELKLVLELPDMTQYDQWAAASTVKARLRLNGAIIASTYRHYINFDVYGTMEGLEWGEYEGAKTMQVTTMSQYDAVAGYDFALAVQNDRATL